MQEPCATAVLRAKRAPQLYPATQTRKRTSTMKSLTWVSACTFLLFSAALANAQPGCSVSAPGTQVTKLPPVTGAPFSADIVLEYKRVLGDGTRIANERHGRIDRDSQGR